MSQTPTIAALVTHKVAHFEGWKRVFDAHQAARREAGILGHHITRSLDDENDVTVYLPAVDRARLEAFLGSESLKTAFSDAGLLSPPQFTLLKPMVDRHIGDRDTAAMIVVHEVEDYGAWRKIYDGLASWRAEKGIIGDAVNQRADDANVVVVYHQAATTEALQAFAADPTLKQAMAGGGVKGKPEMRFGRAPAGARY